MQDCKHLKMASELIKPRFRDWHVLKIHRSFLFQLDHFLKNTYLFGWHQVLVLAHGILSCSMWDLVPWKWKSESHSVVSDSLQSHGLYSPWNSPGQNTGVGSHSLLQGIFPTQGSNPGLPVQGSNLGPLNFSHWTIREVPHGISVILGEIMVIGQLLSFQAWYAHTKVSKGRRGYLFYRVPLCW